MSDQIVNEMKSLNQILRVIAGTLQAMQASLRQMAVDTASAPNYVRPLADFADFDWESIGAHVTEADEYGPSAVEWNEFTYTRRSPENKFGEAIWFSRCVGKDANTGQNKYVRLITFKNQMEAEPVSRKAQKAIQAAK